MEWVVLHDAAVSAFFEHGPLIINLHDKVVIQIKLHFCTMQTSDF